VDFGLFFFAFANAGVELSSMGTITWVILAALLIGKTVGITFFALMGSLMGFPLPEGMKIKHLVVAGVVAGLGLTVALFVTGEAYPGDNPFQGPAKMGAVFSAGAAFLAIALGKVLGVHESSDS
jgi:NhaA family Na+:H+ antiporter